MARRNTVNYTMRDRRGRIQKFGITNNPSRRERENRRDGVRGTLRVEGPRVTRKTALRRERRRIESYRARTGRRPPRNKM